MMINRDIDNGKAFDWGRASADYAKYRDIYPDEFYNRLLSLGLCRSGLRVLDIGTGTGVLPRNLYRCGAKFVGVDSSENQIAEAKKLADEAGMDIEFQCVPAEKIEFSENSFDVVTACQCFAYFNHAKLAPRLHTLLKPGGRFAVVYMAWLPDEDPVAGKSEELVLKYNPLWTGCKEKRRPIDVPDVYLDYFTPVHQEVFDIAVPFTRESWHGRIRSCRGVDASLSEKEIQLFDREHKALLRSIAPQNFEIPHYAAVSVLEKK